MSVSPTINSAETTEDAKRGRVSIKYEEKDRDDNSKEDHQTPTRSVRIVKISIKLMDDFFYWVKCKK